MTDMHSFSRDKQRAIEQMLDMNKKASFSERGNRQNTDKPIRQQTQNSHRGFALDISNDGMLILGLILILAEDCRDKWLFLALVYILT